MQRLAYFLASLSLLACSSDTVTGSSSGSACADIVGNYSVTGERVSGTCDPSLDAKGAVSVSVQKAPDGTLNIVLPGVKGGCPGTLDTNTCKFTATCEFTGQNGGTVGTSSVTYTFSSTGYTGSSVNGLRPPAVATACEVTYKETGTKL